RGPAGGAPGRPAGGRRRAVRRRVRRRAPVGVITIDDIRRAAGIVYEVAVRTPVFSSRHLSRRAGADVHLKAENLPRTGSLKIRGGFNRIPAAGADQRLRGVVAASAGNHAQGVSLAAQLLGVPSTICMPAGASIAKIEATRANGATIHLGGETYHEAAVAARDLASRTGATFVSAFDDELVIAGQGTVGLELAEQVPELDIVVVPCGGGGLLSGIALALRALQPSVRIVGVQAAGCDPMVTSVQLGRGEPVSRVETIADGIAVKRPGEITFPIVRDIVDELVTVGDEEIVETINLLLERHKLLVEGAGAAAAAAVISGRIGGLEGRRVGVVLSGG